MHDAGACGLAALDRFDESVEIVFGSRIPPRVIRRVIPLDRPGTERHRRRERGDQATASADHGGGNCAR